MTDPLVDALRMLVAVALLLSIGVGLGWGVWQALRYLADVGRARPRLVVVMRRPTPGREPQPPRSALAWRHGRNDLADRDSPPTNETP